ncbi:hypothetical protein BJ742DRAFT_740122 [Cladochytrium replicatum]|nr:hypothetical protein BJ742DRAFT_740122 [Cladochytrium replicatum]
MVLEEAWGTKTPALIWVRDMKKVFDSQSPVATGDAFRALRILYHAATFLLPMAAGQSRIALANGLSEPFNVDSASLRKARDLAGHTDILLICRGGTLGISHRSSDVQLKRSQCQQVSGIETNDMKKLAIVTSTAGAGSVIGDRENSGNWFGVHPGSKLHGQQMVTEIKQTLQKIKKKAVSGRMTVYIANMIRYGSGSAELAKEAGSVCRSNECAHMEQAVLRTLRTSAWRRRETCKCACEEDFEEHKVEEEEKEN